MIIDLRKQKRVIKIELEKTGYDYDLDRLVDSLVESIKIICEQRELPREVKIEIILE